MKVRLGFPGLGDDVNKSLEEGKAAPGLADLAGVGIQGALGFTGGKYRQMLQKDVDPRHW